MHLQQLPSGLWRAQVKHGGIRRWTTATRTQRQARTLAAKLITEMEAASGPRRRRGVHTVADLVDRVIAAGIDHRNGRPWSATYRVEIDRARKRIPAELAATNVRDVDGAQLDATYAALRADGVKPGAIIRIHELLSVSFGWAIQWGWVSASPMKAATKPRGEERAWVSAPAPVDVQRLAAAIEADPRFAAFVRLAMVTGARRGELCGLRWGDVDLEAGSVQFVRSVACVPELGLVVKDIKTGRRGRRVVAIDAGTVAALERWRRVKAARDALTVADGAAVFGGLVDHVRPDWATQRWVRLCRSLGVSGVRLHDLRHFSASRLLGAGVDPVTVAGRLGHSTPRTTLSIYAHFLPERDRAAAELIAGEL